MRFLSVLLNISQDEINNNVIKQNDINNDDVQYHFYDNILYEKYKLMSYIYNSDKFLQENFKKIVPISHPFELTKSVIGSSFIPNGSFKITNAFMNNTSYK